MKIPKLNFTDSNGCRAAKIAAIAAKDKLILEKRKKREKKKKRVRE